MPPYAVTHPTVCQSAEGNSKCWQQSGKNTHRSYLLVRVICCVLMHTFKNSASVTLDWLHDRHTRWVGLSSNLSTLLKFQITTLSSKNR